MLKTFRSKYLNLGACALGIGAGLLLSAYSPRAEAQTTTPPNIMLLLDNSDSMFELPYGTHLTYNADNTRNGAGCNNPVLDSMLAAGSFSMSRGYPPIDRGVDPSGLPGDTGFPNLFQENLFYVDDAPERCCGHLGWQEMKADGRLLTNPAVTEEPYPNGDAGQWWTLAPEAKLGACDRTSNPAECTQCVSTKGYYLDPAPPVVKTNTTRHLPPSDVFSGKLLNYVPPKYLQARTAVKRLAWSTQSARLGLTIFNLSNGGSLRVGLAPACDNLASTHTAWRQNRERIVFNLNADPWWNPSTYPYGIRHGVSFFANTPMAETLLDVGQYFTANQATFNSWFGPGWYDGEFRNDYTQAQRSVCSANQVNAVIVLTDTEAFRDNCLPQALKSAAPTCPYPGCAASTYGWSCSEGFSSRYVPAGVSKSSTCPLLCGSTGTESCCNSNTERRFFMDAVAQWFNTRDLVPDNLPGGAPGPQRLITYVVGLGVDHPALQHTAEVGGGTYHTPNDYASLRSTLSGIVGSIQQRAATNP
jgi:type IV pilus assembly protein PilY1